MAKQDPYSKIVKFIEKASKILITTHINPDGDGVGSMLALRNLLAAVGREALMYNEDVIPDSLMFLPGADEIVNSLKGTNYDAVIMVDCAEPKRAGKEFAAGIDGKNIAVIDHHMYSDLEGAVMCLDKEAASTGEVVWKLIKHYDVERTVEMALCIYTTLVVDTGFFRYSNTSSDVLTLAAELVGLGADPWMVAKNLDESYSENRLRLLCESLESLKVTLDGRYALMEVTDDMLKRTGATLVDSDEFATYPRSIKSVEVAALFRDIPGDSVKVSLRSKDYVNVAEIARRHGGGGHKYAAGCTLKCDIKEAKELIEKEIKKILK